MPILQHYNSRLQIGAVSATQVNFLAPDLARRPIVLAKDGRFAELTSLPTALTISGGAGLKYVYADLAAPAGNGWRETTVGFITRLANAVTPNRADWWTPLTLLLPSDTSLTSASHGSTVTLVQSTTAPASEATEYRLPLGIVIWSGAAITAVFPFFGEPAGDPITGECQLTLSGGNLRLDPYDGNALRINGQIERVPTSGVTLTPSGNSATYSIYAFMSSGTMTLEASATGPATHTDGTAIKTGDATRAYVGEAVLVAGPVWSTVVPVRSRFNPVTRVESLQAADMTEHTTTSTLTVDLATLPINIQLGEGLIIRGMARKTVGAAVTASLGLKINAGQVVNNFAVFSATNQAESGEFAFGLEPGIYGVSRQGSYNGVARLTALTGLVTAPVLYTGALNGALPGSAWTECTITGLTGNAAVTLGIRDMVAYRIARS